LSPANRHFPLVLRCYLACFKGYRQNASTLDQIPMSNCVASSGSHERIRFTLGLTGLFDRFEGRIFSVDDDSQGKPAPDIFLHAAEMMGTPPDRCAVIEDSISGVTAGLAAGMAVFAFAGGVTGSVQLSIDNAVIFEDMRNLPAALAI
jgi:HAD superfamily hydrolase (TIGR01549 family)